MKRQEYVNEMTRKGKRMKRRKAIDMVLSVPEQLSMKAEIDSVNEESVKNDKLDHYRHDAETIVINEDVINEYEDNQMINSLSSIHEECINSNEQHMEHTKETNTVSPLVQGITSESVRRIDENDNDQEDSDIVNHMEEEKEENINGNQERKTEKAKAGNKTKEKKTKESKPSK